MNPLNPFFAVIIYLIAFLTGYIIKSKYNTYPQKGRYECIDGMRGFLALAVFIYHASIWGGFFRSNSWDNNSCLLDSNLYPQFGSTSVTFFFMITSFLFVSRLLNSNEKGFDWRNFFISRIFRLVPMYYFSVLLMIIIIMFMSQWHLNVSLSEFFLSIINWLFFTIYKTPYMHNQGFAPYINNQGFTNLINFGVEWTLSYEWLFYFSLPLISIFILKIKPKIGYIILSVFFILFFYKVQGVYEYFIYPFIGGGIAPFLIKYTSFYKKIKDVYASIIILICLFLIIQFNNAHNIYCLLLITIVFTLIALGASLFGLLKNSIIKFLGEISYSTYLLHGILLYTIFDFGFGFEKIKHFTPFAYCSVIFSITPILVIISFLGFKYIEKPFIDKAQAINQKLKTS